VTFRVQQTQFAAGHGGLHLGRIDVGTRLFAWSYDSGTYGRKQVIDREVAEATTRLSTSAGSANINVHFISHFHEDHVKGLPTLGGSSQIGCIVAPLLDPWERLAQVINHPNPSDFALQLAADPGTVLSGLAGGVALVPPGGGPLAPPPVDPSPDDEQLPITPALSSGAGPVSSVDATFTLRAGSTPIWILAPFVPPQLNVGRPDFVAELARRWRVSSSQVEQDLADPAAFLKLVATRNKRTKLRDAYLAALRAAALPRDQNWTSLLLYSGPYGLRRRWRSRWPTPSGNPAPGDPREGSPWGSNAGWLHTGDACLGDASMLQEVTTYYGSWLETLGTLQAPHHGSGGNWHSTLATRAGAGANIVVAGVPGYRGWPLPATQLQMDVAAAGSSLVQVTDDPGSRFSDTWTISIA